MEVDVVIAGGNPGGCAAALAAARSGASVLLLEPTQVLGGMNANGTFGFDCATPQALSGIAEEVASRVRAHYAAIGLEDPLFTQRADLVWESHVLSKVWHELLDETPGLRYLTRAVPVGVSVDNGRIRALDWQEACDPMGNIAPGNTERHTVAARLFIDASYEGDVTAWSGAAWRLGREGRSREEPHAGRIFTNNQDFSKDGTLPHSILPGSTGEGDDSIMAFASRLHCRLYEDESPDAPHRLKQPPPGYDPSVYRWGPVATRPDGTPVYFNTLYVLVNHKYLLNRMVNGNNLVGPNREYILAHPRDRRALRQRFIDRALGYLYFIQNEGGMPRLGLAHDEFQDNGNVPYQIYVREGRRLVGARTLTEADVNPFVAGDGIRPPPQSDVIAIGDWTFESQGCADETPPDYKYPDGYLINRATRSPYQVPYGCLLSHEVENLLVCGPLSATHIAWGAVRCEAARIQTGIAAGLAAALALQRGCKPAELPVDDIQREIVGRRGKLTYFADVETGHPHFAAIQWAALRSFVPADPDWRFEPDHPATWEDFVKATVLCLGLPISVTGAHFEGVSRHHPSYRYVETLYDAGTRAGVDLFGAKLLANEDPMQEFLRLYPNFKLIPFHPRWPVRLQAAVSFLEDLALALRGAPLRLTDAVTPGMGAPADAALLTRGTMCALLQRIWTAGSTRFAALD